MAEPQGEPGIGQMYGHIAQQLQILTHQVKNQTEAAGSQAVSLTIKTFDGTKAADFKDWITSIDKHAYLYGNSDEKRKLTAYQASSGAVSDFIKRFLDSRPTENFNTLRRELSNRFSDVADRAHAFALLGKTKQKQDEGVQIYAERLLTLAREAYDNVQDGAAAIVDQQLIEFFIDGLRNDTIKLKILRDRPDTFERAVRLAMEEQNLRKRFEIRTGRRGFETQPSDISHTPMEVDHISPKRGCFKCGGKHMARDCRYRPRQVNSIQHGPQSRPPLVCWNCHRPGHKAIECKAPKKWDPQGYSRTVYRRNASGEKNYRQNTEQRKN